ncbi:MAG: hypothetical protein R3F29_11630 [Planctomycetota bacterium]
MPVPSDLPAEPFGPWRLVRGLLLTLVALIALLAAPREAVGRVATADLGASPRVAVDAVPVSAGPAAVERGAAEHAPDPVDPVVLAAADAGDGFPSALDFEESEEELHALVAATGRYVSPTADANPSRRSAPRRATADWHVVAPSRAPPA